MKKGTILPAVLLAISVVIGIAGYFAGKTQTLGAIPIESAFFEDSLGAKMSSSQTTMTLYRGTNNEGSAISGTFGFVIDEGGTNQEVVVCTCSGTACTSCLRGIDSTDGQSEITANKKEHRRGESVKMTDHPTLVRVIRALNGTDAVEGTLYYQTSPVSPSSTAIVDKATTDGLYAALAGNNTLTGTLTITGTTTMTTTTFDAIPTIPATGQSADTDVASKKYVDDVAISGAPTSSTSTAGLVFMSTAPADSNVPIAVGSNDPAMTHPTINFGSVGTTTATTSVESGYDVMVWGTNHFNSSIISLCAKRPSGATTTLATGVVDATAHAIPATLMGIYDNPTTTTEIIEFYLSSSTCSAVYPNTESSGVNAGRINYLIIK